MTSYWWIRASSCDPPSSALSPTRSKPQPTKKIYSASAGSVPSSKPTRWIYVASGTLMQSPQETGCEIHPSPDVGEGGSYKNHPPSLCLTDHAFSMLLRRQVRKQQSQRSEVMWTSPKGLLGKPTSEDQQEV